MEIVTRIGPLYQLVLVVTTTMTGFAELPVHDVKQNQANTADDREDSGVGALSAMVVTKPKVTGDNRE